MLVLFVISNEVSRRSVQPILEKMMALGVDCYLEESPFLLNYKNIFSNIFIAQEHAKTRTWDFIISANPMRRNDYKGKRISVPHGSMFGNNSWTLNMAHHSDLYFALSEYEFFYLKKYFKDKFDKSRFMPSGSPANDYLLQYRHANNTQKSNIRDEFGLKDLPTILLTSHWTSMGNLRRFGTGLLDALAWNFPNHQIVCCFHPALLSNPKSEFRINKNINALHFDINWLLKSLDDQARRHKHIKIIKTIDIPAKLLAVTDIFIGDNSSFLAEASYFDKPLVACLDGSYFDQSIHKIVESSVHQFNNIEGLLGHVSTITQEPSANIKRGENIKKLFMHNIGSATETIVKTLTTM